ncbi:MAG TPA: hypothetical protein VGO09_00700 [Flavisolibacter sp.]|nr:hypothetical protein [Flavisolibacter sp.]
MSINISNNDRAKLRTIYDELKNMMPTFRDLERIEILLNSAIQIAEKYGHRGNELLKDLLQTQLQQLKPAKESKAMKKITVIEDLKLYLQGDLLGWI